MRRTALTWRWRRNPLRRRSYLLEAWLVPLAALIAVGAGVLVGLAVDRSAHAVYAAQHRDRHPVSAVLTGDAPHDAAYARATVRWTAADGTPRTGVAEVRAGLRSGARTTVWTDDRGVLVAAPLSEGKARVEAGLTGGLAGLSVCLVLLSGCAAGSLCAARRREAQWETEWARIDPGWDRRRA